MKIPYVKPAPASRKEALDAIEFLRTGAKAPVGKHGALKKAKPPKKVWMHLQSHRARDKAMDDVDAYVARRAQKRNQQLAKDDLELEKALKKTPEQLAQEKQDEKDAYDKLYPGPKRNVDHEKHLEKKARKRVVPIKEKKWYGGQNLNALNDNDHLYLVSHGMLGGPVIGNWEVANDQYSPDDVADRLVAGGLPKTHRIIKLFACWGATAVDPRGDAVPEYMEDAGPFALRLARAMARRGYKDLLVYGYGGTVSAQVNKDSQEAEKHIDMAYKVTPEEYPELSKEVGKAASKDGLDELIDGTELGYLKNLSPQGFKTAFGVDPDADANDKDPAIVALEGWEFRGIYVTDKKKVPWILVIPWPLAAAKAKVRPQQD